MTQHFVLMGARLSIDGHVEGFSEIGGKFSQVVGLFIIYVIVCDKRELFMMYERVFGS